MKTFAHIFICLQVLKLDQLLAAKAGFQRIWQVTGQTYPRKLDTEIVNVLSSLGASIHKICTDIRLLASFKEVEEPFETSQVSSCYYPRWILWMENDFVIFT